MTTNYETSQGAGNGAASVSQSPVIGSGDLKAQLSPYLLHHSVTPTANLVTQQLIGSSKYVS